MKTFILILCMVLLGSIYDDVHALRVKFAPKLPDVETEYRDDAANHPQPAHKPDAR